jgi:hypothetical protein
VAWFVPMTETDDVLAHESFDDATKRAVCDAFNGAWLLMRTEADPVVNSGRHPDARALLARRIIGAARMGMRDVTALQWEGIRYLRGALTPNWPKD